MFLTILVKCRRWFCRGLQLVLTDEWSRATLQSDVAKTILQGGWMVTAFKHGLSRTIMNNSPFYITSNEVPEFGDDDENAVSQCLKRNLCRSVLMVQIAGCSIMQWIAFLRWQTK